MASGGRRLAYILVFIVLIGLILLLLPHTTVSSDEAVSSDNTLGVVLLDPYGNPVPLVRRPDGIYEPAKTLSFYVGAGQEVSDIETKLVVGGRASGYPNTLSFEAKIYFIVYGEDGKKLNTYTHTFTYSLPIDYSVFTYTNKTVYNIFGKTIVIEKDDKGLSWKLVYPQIASRGTTHQIYHALDHQSLLNPHVSYNLKNPNQTFQPVLLYYLETPQ